MRVKPTKRERELMLEVSALRAALGIIAAGNPASPGKWLSDVQMANIARTALAPATTKEPTTVIADRMISIMAPMNDDERLAILDRFNERYCKHCGGEQPASGRRCQCWNDE